MDARKTMRRLVAPGAVSAGLLYTLAAPQVSAESFYPWIALPQPAVPHDVVQGSNGDFYAAYDRQDGQPSVVLAIAPDGVSSPLHAFDSGYLAALSAGAGGTLYGMLAPGSGGAFSVTVFSLDTAGNYTALATPTQNCQLPVFLRYASDGNLYGGCQLGGSASVGILFRFGTDGSYTVLHEFTAAETQSIGDRPLGAPLLAGDGNLYGMLSNGPNGTGAIYRLAPDGTLTALHTFSAVDSDGRNADGWAGPYSSNNGSYMNTWGLTQAGDGMLYGGTPRGGPNGNGVLFRISTGGSFSPVHAFGAGTRVQTSVSPDGAFFQGTMAQGPDGSLYGITGLGGGGGGGVVFRIDPAGRYSVLHSFFGPAFDDIYDIFPNSSPIVDGAGNVYGSAHGIYLEDYSSEHPAIYKIDASAPLTADLAFTPASVAPGTPVTLAWSAPGTQQCTLNLVGLRPRQYAVDIAGSFGFTPVLPVGWTAGLACVAADGAEATGSAGLAVGSAALRGP